MTSGDLTATGGGAIVQRMLVALRPVLRLWPLLVFLVVLAFFAVAGLQR